MFLAAVSLLIAPTPASEFETAMQCILERIPAELRAGRSGAIPENLVRRLRASSSEAAQGCSRWGPNVEQMLLGRVVLWLTLEHIAETLRRDGSDPDLVHAWLAEQTAETRAEISDRIGTSSLEALLARMRAAGVSGSAAGVNAVAVQALLDHLLTLDNLCRSDSHGQRGLSWPLRSERPCG